MTEQKRHRFFALPAPLVARARAEALATGETRDAVVRAAILELLQTLGVKVDEERHGAMHDAPAGQCR